MTLLLLSASLALLQCARRRQPPPPRIPGLEEGAVLHAATCGTSRSARGAGAAKQDTRNLAVLTATLHQRADAERLYGEWAQRLRAAGTVTLCGPSVLVTLPRTEQDELGRLMADAAARTRDVVSVRETWQIRVDLMCRAADARAATAIDDELAVQLGAADRATLVPAWAPRDAHDGGEAKTERARLRAENQLARHTYGLWFHHVLLAEAPPDQVTGVVRKISARPPGSEESDRSALNDEVSALEDEAAAKEVAKIRQGAYGPFDAPTLDLLAAFRHRWPDPTTPLGRQLTEHLGVASPDDSVALAAGATAGSYDIRAADVSVFGLTFRRPDVGLPAFIDWLCAERCADIRYRLKVLE
jgi:hypothetical protein